MGFLKKIGGAFKKIGSGIKKVASGVVKFAKSPIGKMLIGAGLTALTGGAAGPLLGKVLAGSKLANLGNLFGGVASKFLGQATSLLSKTGLSTVFNFAKTAMNSGDLLKIAQDLIGARKAQPQQADPSTGVDEMANHNIAQLLAMIQAQQIRGQMAADVG